DLARTSRTPFVFLLVGLLGGGLLCLLLINTILDTGSYQITQLQQQNVTLAQRTQTLQAQIAYEESPTVLAKQARQLGMREPGRLHFLDLRKGQIEGEPGHVPGVSVWPPGCPRGRGAAGGAGGGAGTAGGRPRPRQSRPGPGGQPGAGPATRRRAGPAPPTAWNHRRAARAPVPGGRPRRPMALVPGAHGPG